MNEFIRKLKNSEPDLTGQEALDKLNAAIEARGQGSTIYTGSTHGFDKTIEIIEFFLNTSSKIASTTGEFIYSYSPYSILRIDNTWKDPDKEVVNQSATWVMLYSNCLILYVESYKGDEDKLFSEIIFNVLTEDIEKFYSDNIGSK